MNDLATLLLFLSNTKTQYSIYTKPDCIDEDSVKAGAVLAISIRDAAHINFDTQGRVVGTSTDFAKSHKLREK